MDLIQLILVLILGIIAGTFTGLIPGIHINLIASIILIYFVHLNLYFDISSIVVFIIAMGVTHTFIDFIPSVLFGVPSEDTFLSVMPAHRLVLQGEAYKAIFISSIGSLFGVFFIVLFSPVFYFGLEKLYNNINFMIPYVLIFVSLYLIISEKNLNLRIWAFIIALFSGFFGLFLLNTYIVDNPLLLLFTGMFGITSIFYSLFENSKLPEQKFEFKFNFDKDFFKAIFVGGVSSSVCCISPGMGNAQAATISTSFYKDINTENFIILTSAINTINFVLSIITFHLINKSRNGAIITVSQIAQEISFRQSIFYIILVLIISFIVFFFTLFLGKKLINIISKLNMMKINLAILIFLLIVILTLTGFYGILILLCSFFLGILAVSIGVRRIHLMNALLIPVIINLI